MAGQGKWGRATVATALGLLAALILTATTSAETIQNGNLRVSFDGSVSPRVLPRQGPAPVSVGLSGDVITTDGLIPPQLRQVRIAINRQGRLDYAGLPACHLGQINPATTGEAIQACERSIVGKGRFRAHVVLPEQSPFPSAGKITVFYGRRDGHAVLFGHVYGTSPLPQSQVIVFQLGHAKGRFGSTFTADLPQVAAEWGYISGLSLTLGRVFSVHGRQRSFISADCPAPAGFPQAVFAIARAEFGFEDGRRVGATMTRSCRAKG